MNKNKIIINFKKNYDMNKKKKNVIPINRIVKISFIKSYIIIMYLFYYFTIYLLNKIIKIKKNTKYINF